MTYWDLLIPGFVGLFVLIAAIIVIWGQGSQP